MSFPAPWDGPEARTLAQWIETTRLLAEAQTARRELRRKKLQRFDWGEAGEGGSTTRSTRASMSPPPAMRDRPALRELRGQNFPRRSLLEDPPRGKAARAPTPMALAAPKLRGGGSIAARNGMIAAGYQPAVVKIISYGSGAGRATAMAKYVQREEAKLETHDGRLLESAEDISAEMKAWAQKFEQRQPSDDVMTATLKIRGFSDTPKNRARLEAGVNHAFAGHDFAWRFDVDAEGGLSARVVSAMAGVRARRGENDDETVSERFTLSDRRNSGPRILSRWTSAELSARAAQAAGVEAEDVTARIVSTGHGKNAVTQNLLRLTKDGAATGQDGATIGTEAEARAAAAAWSPNLRSHAPRDVMHMLLSAKADNDPQKVLSAARRFLHAEFSDRKFAFALHTDKAEAGHLHVHAIVAVKSESGEKLRTGPAKLRAWRENYAQAAREEGLKIVASAAMERASSQTYGARDKAIVDAADFPRPGREEMDRAYARKNPQMIENARRRIAKAQRNPIRIPENVGQRDVVNASFSAWREIARKNPENEIAAKNVVRLGKAARSGEALARLEKISGSFGRRRDVGEANAEQMREDLRAINAEVAEAASELNGEARAEFNRVAGAALQTLALRTDLQHLKDRGVEAITSAELERLAGPDAERLIQRAREIATREASEARAARDIADRAIDRERRREGHAGFEPASLAQTGADRDAVRAAENVAERERREAAEAQRIARELAEHPAIRVNPAQSESERMAQLRQEQDEAIDKADRRDSEDPQGERPARHRM